MLGSAYIKSEASKDASKAQQQAAQAGIESQEQMFNQSLELQKPYRDAGYNAIGGLQGMMDPTKRGQMLSDYYAGDEFKAMQGQAEEQQMRNAAATGGIRGGQNQAAMASISPMLGQQYMQSMQNQYTGLANMGMGSASQGAQGAMQFGQNQSALQQQAGQAQAQNSLAQGNIWGGLMENAGGIGYSMVRGY